VSAPDALTLDKADDEFWTSDDLILSQTCGFPYRARLHGLVNLVGAPDWGDNDCAAGYYYSVVVVRRNDSRATLEEFSKETFALNSYDSQSGYIAMRNHLADHQHWFGEEVISGAHRDSALMVASGRADIAALDNISWRLMCQHDSFVDELTVLEKTEPTPALPYITSLGVDSNIVFRALDSAISRLSNDERALLGLQGIVEVSASSYLNVPTPAAFSANGL